ncbi:single-stranded DNA-binding protein [Sorangium sp. So ce1024]|uniref:single-stranded DNA-binding protein n=1 Tax=Sorangium sp. So ce1024 TaxID=3133327 RepID=UPI003F11DEC7
MAEGLNKVMLLGNIGADPELRFTQGGQAVLNLRLATTESYLDSSKERKERTDWHNVVVWGKRAEALGKFLAKGSSIFVEGRLQTSSYEAQDGTKRYRTDVVANNVLLTGGGRGRGESAAEDAGGHGGAPSGGRPSAGGGGGGYGRGGASGAGARGGGGGSGRPAPAGPPADDFGGGYGGGSDDDIPFASCDIAHDLRRWGLLPR